MGLNLTATRFAHLLGPLARPAASAARAEDDKDNERDEDEACNDTRSEGEDDDKRDDKDEGRKSRKSKRAKKARAEDEDTGDEDARAEDDEDARAEDDEDDARAESDDDNGDDDSKDKDKGRAKAARMAERARCAAIFRCSAAASRPDVAAHLAFETDMRATAAVALLSAIASGEDRHGGKAATLRARMAGVPLPTIGTDGGVQDRDGPQAAAAMILAAARRARGEE